MNNTPKNVSAVELEKERKKKMQMTMEQFKATSGLGAMTNGSFGPVNGSSDTSTTVGSAVSSVMPAGSYIDPSTGQFSQTPPAPVQPASTNPFEGYTIYIIVAGVLVALYFYQKSKGRGMFDVSGLASDLKRITGGGSKRHHHGDEGEEE
jgi:hypothetical protein